MVISVFRYETKGKNETIKWKYDLFVIEPTGQTNSKDININAWAKRRMRSWEIFGFFFAIQRHSIILLLLLFFPCNIRHANIISCYITSYNLQDNVRSYFKHRFGLHLCLSHYYDIFFFDFLLAPVKVFSIFRFSIICYFSSFLSLLIYYYCISTNPWFCLFALRFVLFSNGLMVVSQYVHKY